MAALCGPSSVLQNLQKHTSADQSFQQDRFRAAPSLSSQGFRSATTSPSGWIENEFDTFSAGAPLVAPEFHAAQQPHSWANDFQRLEISHTPQKYVSPAFQQQQQQQQQPQQWGLEFAARLQQRQEIVHVTQQQNCTSATTSYSGYSPASSPQLDIGMGRMEMSLQQEPVQAATTSATEFQFDESAFEKAFEDAAREVQSEMAFEKVEDHLGPGAQKEPFVKDSDDLARTAGQLLDSVRQDTSTKFQNSNFLALMRRLRDHEVVVEGDKMVEAHS